MFYDIIKSLHIVAVISWMVGLLYLPRLYVYHNETKNNSDMDTTFLKMEYRLYNYIMNPALLVSFLLGLYLLYENKYLLYENYFLIKFFMVLILMLFHLYLNSLYKDFKKGYRNKKTKFYRIINEIPTVLMILIILLIIVKPDINI
ncbi:MAG: TIGR00701 family protein [SAR116 cluster bacterium]|nr:TIGR00701 family protein [SAR116 cluster bacterium]